MKKALVLGVLAFFAISIANVNAQDRTNVQEKPKKSYTQEPASKKNVDTKAVNQTVKQEPAAKNVNVKTNTKKQLPKNTQKTAIDKKATEKTAATGAEITDDVKLTKEAQDNKTTAPATTKKVSSSKANSSVPPTPSAKKTANSSKSKKTVK